MNWNQETSTAVKKHDIDSTATIVTTTFTSTIIKAVKEDNKDSTAMYHSNSDSYLSVWIRMRQLHHRGTSRNNNIKRADLCLWTKTMGKAGPQLENTHFPRAPGRKAV